MVCLSQGEKYNLVQPHLCVPYKRKTPHSSNNEVRRLIDDNTTGRTQNDVEISIRCASKVVGDKRSTIS